jgi:hypothetical protein
MTGIHRRVNMRDPTIGKDTEIVVLEHPLKLNLAHTPPTPKIILSEGETFALKWTVKSIATFAMGIGAPRGAQVYVKVKASESGLVFCPLSFKREKRQDARPFKSTSSLTTTSCTPYTPSLP